MQLEEENQECLQDTLNNFSLTIKKEEDFKIFPFFTFNDIKLFSVS